MIQTSGQSEAVAPKNVQEPIKVFMIVQAMEGFSGTWIVPSDKLSSEVKELLIQNREKGLNKILYKFNLRNKSTRKTSIDDNYEDNLDYLTEVGICEGVPIIIEKILRFTDYDNDEQDVEDSEENFANE